MYILLGVCLFGEEVIMFYVSNLYMLDIFKNKINEFKSILNIKKVDV